MNPKAMERSENATSWPITHCYAYSGPVAVVLSTVIAHELPGSLQSLDWTGGLDWTVGLDWWTGLVDRTKNHFYAH